MDAFLHSNFFNSQDNDENKKLNLDKNSIYDTQSEITNDDSFEREIYDNENNNKKDFVNRKRTRKSSN